MSLSRSPVRVALIVVSFLVPLLGAGVAQSDHLCLDFVARVLPGDTVTVESEEAAWFELEVVFDHAYRFEIGALPGTTYEMWMLGYDNGQDCFVREQQLLSGELDDTTATFGWTNPERYQIGLVIDPPVGGGEVSLSVSLV